MKIVEIDTENVYDGSIKGFIVLGVKKGFLMEWAF